MLELLCIALPLHTERTYCCRPFDISHSKTTLKDSIGAEQRSACSLVVGKHWELKASSPSRTR